MSSFAGRCVWSGVTSRAISGNAGILPASPRSPDSLTGRARQPSKIRIQPHAAITSTTTYTAMTYPRLPLVSKSGRSWPCAALQPRRDGTDWRPRPEAQAMRGAGVISSLRAETTCRYIIGDVLRKPAPGRQRGLAQVTVVRARSPSARVLGRRRQPRVDSGALHTYDVIPVVGAVAPVCAGQAGPKRINSCVRGNFDLIRKAQI